MATERHELLEWRLTRRARQSQNSQTIGAAANWTVTPTRADHKMATPSLKGNEYHEQLAESVMNALATAQVNDSPSWGVRKPDQSDIQWQSAAWILFLAPSYGIV